MSHRKQTENGLIIVQPLKRSEMQVCQLGFPSKKRGAHDYDSHRTHRISELEM